MELYVVLIISFVLLNIRNIRMGIFHGSNSLSDGSIVSYFGKSEEGILLLRKSVYV